MHGKSQDFSSKMHSNDEKWVKCIACLAKFDYNACVHAQCMFRQNTQIAYYVRTMVTTEHSRFLMNNTSTFDTVNSEIVRVKHFFTIGSFRISHSKSENQNFRALNGPILVRLKGPMDFKELITSIYRPELENKINNLLSAKQRHFPRILTWFLLDKFGSKHLPIADFIRTVEILKTVESANQLIPLFIQVIAQQILPKINAQLRFDQIEYHENIDEIWKSLSNELEIGVGYDKGFMRKIPAITDKLDFLSVKNKIIQIISENNSACLFIYDRMVDLVIEVVQKVIRGINAITIVGRKRVGKNTLKFLVLELCKMKKISLSNVKVETTDDTKLEFDSGKNYVFFRDWDDEECEFLAERFLSTECAVLNSPHIYTSISKLALSTFRENQASLFWRALKTFKWLFFKAKTRIYSDLEKFNQGLISIEITKQLVSKMQIELDELQPVLKLRHLEQRELAISVNAKAQQANIVKNNLEKERSALLSFRREAEVIRVDCETDLAKAMPDLISAIKALNTLKQKDIQELKTMKKPADGVKLTMEAVCVLLQVKPNKIKNLKGRLVNDYWSSSKKILSDIKFLAKLKQFDKDNIDEKVAKIIRDKYITNSKFKPEIIQQVSKACSGLCKWIIALSKYDIVAKSIAPKRKRLDQAESELLDQEHKLRDKMNCLENATTEFENISEELRKVEEGCNDLKNEIFDKKRRLMLAEGLILNLGAERVQWACDIQELENLREKIVDVCLEVTRMMVSESEICDNDMLVSNVIISSVVFSKTEVLRWRRLGLPGCSMLRVLSQQLYLWLYVILYC